MIAFNYVIDRRPPARSRGPALLVPDVWPDPEATIAGRDGRSERQFSAESSVLIAHRRIARRKSGLTGRQGNGTSSTSLHRHQTYVRLRGKARTTSTTAFGVRNSRALQEN